jgi:hypothetical protein
MAVAGPFAQHSRRDRRRALWAIGGVTLMQLGPLLALQHRMKRSGGPGIIPFELAGTREKANRILEAWQDDGRAAARKSLILDYPFPASYSLMHALACSEAAETFNERRASKLAAAGGPIAWAQFLAAGCDYVENAALLFILAGRDGRLPQLARRAALVKFALLATGWSYMLLAITNAVLRGEPSRTAADSEAERTKR